MFEDSNMVVLIEMPLTIYQVFVGRCVLGSRESEQFGTKPCSKYMCGSETWWNVFVNWTMRNFF
jgi:hypothetical protein